MISDMFAPAMASLAAPVVCRGTTLGVVTIAGPMVRLTEERMAALSDALGHAAEEVAGLSASSTLFRKRVA
jgi:DNA-binding IclR family transcriptional regulator